MVTAGVLALQGGFDAHARLLRGLGADVREVRRCAALDGLDALVLPGGESTALLRLMEDEPWLDAIRSFHAAGGALLGTCAGAILLARRVVPDQPSLGLLDVTMARNAWGRQADSFEAEVEAGGERVAGVFIRAPRIVETGPGVAVVARLGAEPVAVRAGRIVAATFHPELSGAAVLHRMVLQGARERATA